MIATANREGYAGATISCVIARAGVSRPTFYEYFADRDDCFLTVQRALNEQLLAHVHRAVAAHAPEQAAQAAVTGLLEYARSQPASARFLTNETRAGGPQALSERDRAMTRLSGVVERARARTPSRTAAPDLPARVLLGSVLWLLAAPLRRGEDDLGGFSEDLSEWIERYNRPAGEHRWRTLEPGPTLPPSPYIDELAVDPPSPLPPGRTRFSPAEIARNHRERIIYATAEVAIRKGYNASTVADITKAAHLDRSAFYPHFRDKQEAFLALCELWVQQSLGVSARAFFSAGEWPERVWQAIVAGSHFQARHALLTRAVFVESYAVGVHAVQRIDDGRNAFTLFLQEGAQRAPVPSSQRLLEAITTAAFELGYTLARAGRAGDISRAAPHAVYLSLAPFLGAEPACAFIDDKLKRLAPQAQAKRRRPSRTS